MIDVDSDDSDYFTNLELIFRSLLDPNIYELYQKKLLDRNLSKEPNFQWCVNCTSGFIKRPKQKRLICPDCGLITCSMCSLKVTFYVLINLSQVSKSIFKPIVGGSARRHIMREVFRMEIGKRFCEPGERSPKTFGNKRH